MALVYDNFRLHVTNKAFYIESLNAGAEDVLEIDRIHHDINLRSNKEDIPPSLIQSKVIYGIFGIIRLVSGPHLIVITDRTRVGDILGHTIWKITETQVLPYSEQNVPELQVSDKAFLSMVEYSLATPSLYYSTSYDITHTMQRLADADIGFKAESLSSRTDQRFFWNRHALEEFLDRPELSLFTTPIMHGFVSISSCFVEGRTFDFILISRRSTLRAGTRYNVRGLDAMGDAANFVETEQIVTYARRVCSIVQTRGSIPLLWSQKVNLKYKPSPVINSDKERSMKSFNQHFDSQIITYGKQVAINLVNQKGSELRLANAFLGAIDEAKNPDIRYEAFDFHHECGVNRWHRLSILMDRIAPDQEEFGYFLKDRDGTVLMKQSGVFRTNCIDCLDRTNVVQSLIARRSLESQLKRLGIFKPDTTILSEPDLDYLLKQIWADNADYCSVQYAGTGALKTDFTRTGKRTVFGAAKDGFNSAVRYYKNNFVDGFRQDSIDLLLGNFTATDSAPSPFSSSQQQSRFRIFFTSYILLSVFTFFGVIPASGITEQLGYVLIWIAATVIMLFYVIRNGSDFVNSPNLVHVKRKDD